MDANDKDNEKTHTSSSSYKHPVFDGEDTSKFKEWWDVTYATLEMEDLEEYVGMDYKYTSMPSKSSTVPAADADATTIAVCTMNKKVRKEMKKAKAHMVRVTKEYPRRLVMNADTPFEAYASLKSKYSVAKNRQDFTTLDAQWNEFKVTDVDIDPDKIFATLDEHSKKLSEFGERYEKDALQMLSKYQKAFPEEYKHVFTLLNTAEEHKKSTKIQLDTAKRMIKSHYDTEIKPTGKADDGSMMCMFVSSDKQNNGKAEYKCDHCGKKKHTAYRDGKPFCRELIASLKGNGGDNNKLGSPKKTKGGFRGKCYNCNKMAGHMSRDCPEPKGGKEETDINNLMINVVGFDEDELEIAHVVNDQKYTNMLGDTGAQGHVAPATEGHKNKTITKHLGKVNMANGATAVIYQRDNTTIEDVNGVTVSLKNRRVVEGLHTPIISLTQLMNEGWTMQSKMNKKKNEILMTKGKDTLTFVEQKNNLFYLQARVVKEILVAHYHTSESVKQIATPIISDDEDSDDENDEPPPLTDRAYESSDDEDSDDEDDIEIDAHADTSAATKAKPTYASILKGTKTNTKVRFDPKMDTLNINVAHHQWGHHGEARLRGMASSRGMRLVGKLKECDACGAVKAKAASIPKSTNSDKKAKDIGERLFVDITGPFPLTATRWHKAIRNKLYWYGISDQYSGKMLTAFQFSKDNLVKLVDETFKYFKGQDKKVEYLRMDNAGENLAVERLCKENGVTVEYVPADTPKLNNMVERGFAIRWEIAKTLMQNASLKDNVKRNKKIIVEAIRTACYLNDECIQKGKKLTVNQIFFGSKAKVRVQTKHLIEWGRIGFVANKRTKTAKMDNNGTAMLFVGYALDHPSGTYRMYNPGTDNVVITNSVKWSVFNPWQAQSMDDTTKNLKTNNNNTTKYLTIDSVKKTTDEVEVVQGPMIKEPDTVLLVTPETEPVKSPTRVTRAMARADQETQQQVYKEYNEATGQTFKVTGDTTAVQIDMPNTDSELDGNSGSESDDTEISYIWTDDIAAMTKTDGIADEDELLDFYVMHACIQSDPGEPNSWKDALSGTEREWWMKAIRSEFNNFLNRGGWKFVPLTEVLDSGRKLVPTKLVFKKKDEIDDSVRFKARCVTMGFMMVPGVDFTERFSPVATDESLKMQIGINLFNYQNGWETHSCDIEAAFLEPTMDNVMYIEPHPAMVECGFMTEEQRKQLAIRLMKSMYGNVDAAIKFFKVLTRWIVDNMKMKQSLADPCVFYKLDKNDKLEIMVGVTVDDCAVTGLPLNIEWFMKGLEGRFKITRGGLLKKHLGVDYEWGVLPNGKAFCKATMDKKVNTLVEAYEKHIGKEAKIYETPGKPHEYLSKSEDEEPVDIDQYRSFVGQLMFFTTKLYPKMGTSTRALSGFMSKPNETHWKALGRAIGYLKGVELKGLMYVQPESFRMSSLADTDYGNCPETRRSVGCSIFTMGCCIIGWHMAKHVTMSDSSCEAEYKELAKCAKGTKFVQMLLEELRLAELPGLLFEDNSGAIFLAGNKQVSKRTKHIDLKHHFIREFTEDRNGYQQGKIFKIETALNTADIGTKNVEKHLFIKHAHEIDNGMPMLRERIYGKNGILT